MIRSRFRQALLAVALFAGLAAVGAGCDDHGDGRHRDDVDFEVDNHHTHTIYIEGIDDRGEAVLLGHVFEREEVDFVLSDYWRGRELHAHCDEDDDLLDIEFAYDGLHWDVF